MMTVKIHTAQNVDIEYEIANVGDRILAYLVDALIIIVYSIALIFIFKFLNDSGFELGGIFWLLFFLLPFMLYDLICEIFLNGQSIGKQVRKIKVVKLDGSQPTVGGYLLRWLFRLIDISLSYGSVALLTILITGKGQRLGDIAAGTTVVKLKPRTKFGDTIFAKVDEDYSPVFNQAVELDDKIIATVKEVLDVTVEEDRHNVISFNLAKKTKLAVENKMGVQSGLPSRTFLQTVLKDYNYLKGKL